MKKDMFIAVLSMHNKNAKGEIQLTRDVDELNAALGFLGIEKANIMIGELSGQIFDSSNQEIRECLISLRNKIKPTLVFFPSSSDVHQDHDALAKEAYRIFRNENCFGYEIIRSSLHFFPNLYIKMNKEEIEMKSAAVLMYASQKSESAGYYFSKEAITSLSQYRGIQVGVEYAEAFECYKTILND